MRILVTGSTGFVGGWLVPELEAAGHAVVGMPDPDVLDIADAAAVRGAVIDARPDGIVHLAGMAYAPDATTDAAEAIRVNVGGTVAVLEACREVRPGASILVVGSADVYRAPTDGAPLSEASPLGPRGVYGLTKLAAEGLAVAMGVSGDLRVAVARSFNHSGPGQRAVFAVPAIARRILDARGAGVRDIRAGNVDVARDISDVRDVVRAYRLLIEALASGRVPPERPVFNIGAGRAVTIRSVIEQLALIADWAVTVTPDPDLVRSDDPPVLFADTAAVRALTGWEPRVPLAQTLEDVVLALDAQTAAEPSS